MKRLLPFQGWRLYFFQGIVIALFLVFSLRLYQLQFIDYETYEADANENRLSALPLSTSRGVIRDRDGTRLAFNVPAYNVTIVPAELPSDEDTVLEIYNKLSALVGVPPTAEIARSEGNDVISIEEMVQTGEGFRPFSPVTIATDVPRRVMIEILEDRIFMPGVDIQTVSVREYPTGATTAHIIGYMGPIAEDEAAELREQGYDPAYDRIGYEGIERYLQSELAGARGEELREVDVAGEVINVIERRESEPGQSVRLTIDTDLQAAAETALLRMLQYRNENPQGWKGLSNQGVVVALNPQTGEVLALVSWPTFDNTRFARSIDYEYYLDITADPARPLVNNAIKGLYPPGSVFKLITAAGVAEENVIDPMQNLRDEGSLLLENRYAPNDPAAAQRFVCWLPGGHGSVNLIESIAWSCDVYFYQVGGGNSNISESVLKSGGLGIDGLFRYATATGIGSELGIELPFENPGRMPDPDWKRRNYGQAWSTGDTYNAAFGQGYVTVTPLQLASQVASLINGGTLYQPTLIREFLDEEGNVLNPFEPMVLRSVNLDNVPANEPLTLLMVEDMLLKGPSSLSCICESTSDFYDPARCDPEGYRNTVNVGDTFAPVEREYKVHIPYNYNFTSAVCQPVRFPPTISPYDPAFVSTESLGYVRQGTLEAVYGEGGTASAAALDYTIVAGKTGTAEYCDDIARPLGYCVQGSWPAHAWYAGYAPFEDPEILIVAFVYNGGEGSSVALPVVRETMDAYFQLKNNAAAGQDREIDLGDLITPTDTTNTTTGPTETTSDTSSIDTAPTDTAP
ncbi:penicillin-binding protein 2 [Phototrophicus methaneseepsis]|uniref:Penicillin-binding protein 2 n=1 Tax=Phototrophicus methaneseepsis TaxID=2710758 RepID=A0A7S8E775_9CHLR|nr:penicillin-binding protein 2 [Phototrophicus methaneseepsis]QPC81624.1 penicillin-binding protein 2 [Phototrophicus methaneseepsis]